MDKNIGELQSRVGLAILAFVFHITRWPSLLSLNPYILNNIKVLTPQCTLGLVLVLIFIGDDHQKFITGLPMDNRSY